MPISDLPPELHAHIVALSCFQTSSPVELPTTYAISFVSSYWNSIAKPFRYHTLRISGGSSIAKLFAHLSGLPEHERRVHYLSLSDSPRSEGRFDEETAFQRKANMGRLLALVAPSLFALELCLEDLTYSTSLFAFLWQLSYPHLVSLSIKGLYCFPVLQVCQTQTGFMETNFPRLEHLSLDGCPNPTGLLTHDLLGSAFPALASLEIRGLRCALAFARELADAIAQRDGDSKRNPKEEAAVAVSRLPRTLRSLTLFTSTSTSNEYSKRAKMLNEQMMDILARLTKPNPEERRMDSDLQVVLVNSNMDKDVRS